MLLSYSPAKQCVDNRDTCHRSHAPLLLGVLLKRTAMPVQLAAPRAVHSKPRSLCRIDIPGESKESYCGHAAVIAAPHGLESDVWIKLPGQDEHVARCSAAGGGNEVSDVHRQ